MRYLYLVLVVIVTTLIAVFMVQNLGTVTVHLLTVSFSLPLFLLVLMVYGLGMISGGALLKVFRDWLRRSQPAADGAARR